MLNSIKAKIKKIYYIRMKKCSMEDYKLMIWREQGMKIGQDVHIYSDIYSKEPYMVEIGDGTTISGNVTLVTHDNSISKYLQKYTDNFGKIVIGKNCFVGMCALILPGCYLADNIIVGAGSVVTRSFMERGVVIAGNPAKIIGNVKDLKIKNEKYGINIKGMTMENKREYLISHPERLLKK